MTVFQLFRELAILSAGYYSCKNWTCHQATSHRPAVVFFLTFVQMHVLYWNVQALLLLIFVGV